MRVLTVLYLLLATIAITLAAAGPSYIIDVDGSVESMAALATLVTHPTSSTQIGLVSVTGTAWGTLTVAENNVRAFLKLAGRDDIQVTVGTSSTIGDLPDVGAVETDAAAPGGSCDDTKLFPPTPAMAIARGLWRSRYDEDDLYGAADALPLPSNYGTKSKEVTAQMSSLYNQLSSGNRVVYIATAGLTNLARFIKYGNANAVNSMILLTDIHIYENGNNLCLDSSATELVMGKQALGLVATLYTPTMLAPVKMSVSSWTSLKLASKSSGTKASVTWLFSVLQGRKNAVDTSAGATAATFFETDSSLGAAFVVMAAVDSTVISAGKGLLVATNENRKLVQYYRIVQASKPGLGELILRGNNVTRGGFLSLIPLPAVAGSGGVIVITESATKVSGGNSVSLVDTFWTQWRSIMLS